MGQKSNLTEHGILNEASDYRAHVCPRTFRCYFFRTEDGRDVVKKLIAEGVLPKKIKDPKSGGEAEGYAVPLTMLPMARIEEFPFGWIEPYYDGLSTSEKGQIAIGIVERLLRLAGHDICIIPAGTPLNISGVDIVSDGVTKYEVKMDGKGGAKDMGGSGNLFLQTRERNPQGHV